MRAFAALLVLLAPLLALADPVCLPKEAGGAGTQSVSRMVLTGGVVSSDPEDARANGGTLAEGGKATAWWCPQRAFNGEPYWVLEWYGWEFSKDQFFGMLGFRPDEPEVVRQAWRATRNLALDRTYFPVNVVMSFQDTKPK